MAALGGWTTVIKFTGSSTAMTTEACTALSTTVHQITDTAKRVLDPDVAVVVWDDGAPEAPSSIDHLFGVVTLGSAAAGAVTINSASYLPLVSLAVASEVSINFSQDMLDATKLASGRSQAQRQVGLKSCSGSIGAIESLETVVDGGTLSTLDLLLNGTPYLLEIIPANGAVAYRAWVIFNDGGLEQPRDDLARATLNFEGAIKAYQNGTYEGFARSDDNTP